MERIALFVIFIYAIASCRHEDTIKIEGSVPDSTFNGSKVYLVALDGPVSKDVDSAIISEGSFSFEKTADSLRVKILRIPARYPDAVEDLVVVLEAGHLNAVLSGNSHGKGTRLNDKLQKWKDKKHTADSMQRDLYSRIKEPGADKKTIDSLMGASAQLSQNYRAYVSDLMNENNQNGIGLLLFKVYYHDLSTGEKLRILKMTENKYIDKDGQLKLMIKSDSSLAK